MYVCFLHFHKHALCEPSELVFVHTLCTYMGIVFGQLTAVFCKSSGVPTPVPYQAHLSHSSKRNAEPHIVYMSSVIAGLGFRQVGQRAFLMVSTNKKVYSIYVSENDKKVV